jgi:homoserine kinase type II
MVTDARTAARLRHLLRHYDIGDLVDARRVESGFVNQNWALTTTQGRFFVKCRHPDLRDTDVISGQHELMDHLRAVGFPAPAIVPVRSGQKLLALDDEVFEIQEYIDHSPYVHGRALHFDAAARMLATYHQAVAGFGAPALSSLGELYGPRALKAGLAHLAERWKSPGEPTYAERLRRLEEQAARLADRLASHGDLPHVVIHGDYYADNLLFEGDEIVGVVDYDKARWQARVAETAEALIYFASPRPGTTRHIVYPGTLEWGSFRRFLQGYAGGATVTEGEARALPDYIGAVWLTHSLRRLAESGGRPPHADEALAEVLALVDWAEQNAGRLVRAARGVW